MYVCIYIHIQIHITSMDYQSLANWDAHPSMTSFLAQASSPTLSQGWLRRLWRCASVAIDLFKVRDFCTSNGGTLWVDGFSLI